jgi:hypothetical protein
VGGRQGRGVRSRRLRRRRRPVPFPSDESCGFLTAVACLCLAPRIRPRRCRIGPKGPTFSEEGITAGRWRGVLRCEGRWRRGRREERGDGELRRARRRRAEAADSDGEPEESWERVAEDRRAFANYLRAERGLPVRSGRVRGSF